MCPFKAKHRFTLPRTTSETQLSELYKKRSFVLWLNIGFIFLLNQEVSNLAALWGVQVFNSINNASSRRENKNRPKTIFSIIPNVPQ